MFWFDILFLLNVQQRCFKEINRGAPVNGVVYTAPARHSRSVLKLLIALRPICHGPGRWVMLRAAPGEAVITPGFAVFLQFNCLFNKVGI